MANGHPEARLYPVPRVWTEVRIVRQRLNMELANNAVLTRMAIVSVLDKKAAGQFKKRIKDLTGG